MHLLRERSPLADNREMFRFWSSFSVENLEIVEDFLTRSTQLRAECLRRSRTSVSDTSKQGRA